LKEIAASKYSTFFWIGLLLTIICAWFSAGYLQLDEHFQVIEFANYKLGKIAASDMIWEFQWKVRATLLPWVAYLFLKLYGLAGMSNPFIAMFLLRLLTGFASWFICCRMCLFLIPNIKNQIAEKIFVLMTMFLWFIPYLNVRFTSENISGLLLLSGVYLILKTLKENRKNILPYIIASFLFAISCFIRIQISFAVLGFIAWMLWAQRPGWKIWFAMLVSAIAGISINFLLDYLFYGQAVFTPYTYFYANIVLHKASSFGQEPFWFFFSGFLIKAVPPLSLFLLIFFFTGIYKNPKDPLVWAVVPFLLIHLLIAHKELRFLFPMVFIFIYTCALGLDYWLQNKTYQKMHKTIFRISAFMCIPLLIYRTILSAETRVDCCEYLYHSANVTQTPFFILSDIVNESMIFDHSSSFYRNPNINYLGVQTYEQVADYLKTHIPETAFCLGNKFLGFNAEINGYRVTEGYCYFPDFILKFNINDWEKRTAIPVIYKLTKLPAGTF
jgi:phosphatidylinositol glycan class B